MFCIYDYFPVFIVIFCWVVDKYWSALTMDVGVRVSMAMAYIDQKIDCSTNNYGSESTVPNMRYENHY